MLSRPDNALAVHETGSLRPFVEAIFRHRRLWLSVAMSALLLAIILTVLTPKQYLSEMDILVQNNRADYQITPQRTLGSATMNGVTEEQINSEIELLRSRGLANVVVDPQWSDETASARRADQLQAHDKAVEHFQKYLAADLVRKSNVIRVTYTASDPHTATDSLKGLLNAFLTKQREIAQPPGTSQFFASEAERYKKELDEAQKGLAEYQQKRQIVSLSDTENNLDREINDTQTQLRNTDAEMNEVSQRIGTQVKQLRTIPTRQPTQERIVPNDYSVERLNTMLAELQNKRTALLTKFTPQDRLVQEVDKQIADTKSALSNARQMTSQERSSDVNPIWQTVTGSIIQNQSERQALKARHDALEQQMSTLRENLNNVESSTVAFGTLKQKVADLENNYQLYTQKRDEAQMADAMNEDRLLNIAVAQFPTFSQTPIRPKPVVNIVLGCFTGMFMASFVVFFAEMGRGTIATPREVDRLLKAPLLATLPLDRARRADHAELHSERPPVSVVMARSKDRVIEEDAGRDLVAYRKEPHAW